MPSLAIAISFLAVPCLLAPGEPGNANRAPTVFTIVAPWWGSDFEGSLQAGASSIYLQLDWRTRIDVSVPGISACFEVNEASRYSHVLVVEAEGALRYCGRTKDIEPGESWSYRSAYCLEATKVSIHPLNEKYKSLGAQVMVEGEAIPVRFDLGAGVVQVTAICNRGVPIFITGRLADGKFSSRIRATGRLHTKGKECLCIDAEMIEPLAPK